MFSSDCLIASARVIHVMHGYGLLCTAARGFSCCECEGRLRGARIRPVVHSCGGVSFCKRAHHKGREGGREKALHRAPRDVGPCPCGAKIRTPAFLQAQPRTELLTLSQAQPSPPLRLERLRSYCNPTLANQPRRELQPRPRPWERPEKDQALTKPEYLVRARSRRSATSAQFTRFHQALT